MAILELAEALARQASRLIVGTFATPERAEAFRMLAEAAPAGLKRAHLYSGGAEAVEAALRLARSKTKRHEVLSFWGGFHGKTGGVIGLIGDESKQGYGPLPGGQYVVPYADCYRCPFKLEYPECGMYCVDFARQQLKHSSAGALAAMVVEPMQGTAGNVIPPDDYLPAVKELAHEQGAMLIADEMITGFGRTGRMWGIEHSGVAPDIMTVGKGMGSGFPVSGVLLSDDLGKSEPFGKPSASSSSYGGNPLAAVAVAETLRAIKREGLIENSAVVGAFMLERLKRLKEKYEFVGDVRGKGLLIGLDLVRDRKTKRDARAFDNRGHFRGGAEARPSGDGLFSAHADQSAVGHHARAGRSGRRDSRRGFRPRPRPSRLAQRSLKEGRERDLS